MIAIPFHLHLVDNITVIVFLSSQAEGSAYWAGQCGSEIDLDPSSVFAISQINPGPSYSAHGHGQTQEHGLLYSIYSLDLLPPVRILPWSAFVQLSVGSLTFLTINTPSSVLAMQMYCSSSSSARSPYPSSSGVLCVCHPVIVFGLPAAPPRQPPA